MNIESQVTSLELSQRLKELDIKNHSIFFWGESLTGRHAETEFNIYASWLPSSNILREYPAYSVAELDELLPGYIDEKFLTLIKYDNQWELSYDFVVSGDHFESHYEQNNNKLADTMAKMLIHLIEQGIYKP